MADQIDTRGESVPGSPPTQSSLVNPSSPGLSPIPERVARGDTVLSDEQFAFAEAQRGIFTARQTRQAIRDATRKKAESDRLRFAMQTAKAEQDELARVERIRRLEESEEDREQVILAQENEVLKSLSPDKSHVPGMEVSWANENLRRLTVAEQLQDQQETVTELIATMASERAANQFKEAANQQIMVEMRAAIENLTSQFRDSGNSPQYLPPVIRLPPGARSTQLSYATAMSESESPTRLPQDPVPLSSSFAFSRHPQPLNFADDGLQSQQRMDSGRPNQDIALYRPHLPHMRGSFATHRAPSPEGPFAVPAIGSGNFELPSSLPRTSMGVVPSTVLTPPHSPNLVTDHPTNPLMWLDGLSGGRHKFSTAFTARDRPVIPTNIHLPAQSGSVKFSQAKEESQKFQVLYGSIFHTWPLFELQVFYAMAGHSARTRDFVSTHIFDIMSLCSSNLIKDALSVCISDKMFNWTSFTFHLSTPSKFEQSTSSHSVQDHVLQASSRGSRSSGKEWGLYSDLSKEEKQALPFDLFGQTLGDVSSGTLISALYTVAGKVLGGPTREELQAFHKGMIIMGDPGHTDPYHVVPSDEGPLGVLQRILYIYHLFLSGPDRSWVQEDLTSMSFTLIKTFSRAITLSARPELHATFIRLMDEGPSARNASDIVRIGLCIKKLQSVYDNSESMVMRDLHRHQRSSALSAVPAVSSLNSNLRPADSTAAVPALPSAGYKRTFFPRKSLAAASTDFDTQEEEDESLPQDEALVAASTQAGAPKPAPILYPPTMNVRGQSARPQPSTPNSPQAPRPNPRPKICGLCGEVNTHWTDQCPALADASQLWKKSKAVQPVSYPPAQPSALSTVYGEVEAFARDYAYMSREEQEEWEAGHHEFDEQVKDPQQLSFTSCMNFPGYIDPEYRPLCNQIMDNFGTQPESEIVARLGTSAPFPFTRMSPIEQALAAERASVFSAFPVKFDRYAHYVTDISAELKDMESGKDVEVKYPPGARLLPNKVRVATLQYFARRKTNPGNALPLPDPLCWVSAVAGVKWNAYPNLTPGGNLYWDFNIRSFSEEEYLSNAQSVIAAYPDDNPWHRTPISIIPADDTESGKFATTVIASVSARLSQSPFNSALDFSAKLLPFVLFALQDLEIITYMRASLSSPHAGMLYWTMPHSVFLILLSMFHNFVTHVELPSAVPVDLPRWLDWQPSASRGPWVSFHLTEPYPSLSQLRSLIPLRHEEDQPDTASPFTAAMSLPFQVVQDPDDIWQLLLRFNQFDIVHQYPEDMIIRMVADGQLILVPAAFLDADVFAPPVVLEDANEEVPPNFIVATSSLPTLHSISTPSEEFLRASLHDNPPDLDAGHTWQVQSPTRVWNDIIFKASYDPLSPVSCKSLRDSISNLKRLAHHLRATNVVWNISALQQDTHVTAFLSLNEATVGSIASSPFATIWTQILTSFSSYTLSLLCDIASAGTQLLSLTLLPEWLQASRPSGPALIQYLRNPISSSTIIRDHWDTESAHSFGSSSPHWVLASCVIRFYKAIGRTCMDTLHSSDLWAFLNISDGGADLTSILHASIKSQYLCHALTFPDAVNSFITELLQCCEARLCYYQDPSDSSHAAATCVLLPSPENVELVSFAAVSARTRNPLPLGWKNPRPVNQATRASPPSSSPVRSVVEEPSLTPFPLTPFTAATPPLTWSTVADPPSDPSTSSPQVFAPVPAARPQSMVNRFMNSHIAAASFHPNPTWRPPAAPTHLAPVIRSLTANISKRSSLDYLLQPQDRLDATVGFIYNGVRFVPPRAFLDSGATICLISFAYATQIGLDIFSTDVKLATSVLSNQGVFGTTGPLVLQYGMPPYSVDIPTIFLVTLDMSQMYDLLISNDASHSFRGTTSNDTQTLTLIRPDGVNVVVPLRPLH
jgi:hypothetical protein